MRTPNQIMDSLYYLQANRNQLQKEASRALALGRLRDAVSLQMHAFSKDIEIAQARQDLLLAETELVNARALSQVNHHLAQRVEVQSVVIEPSDLKD